MLNFSYLKNLIVGYKNHPEAVIVACYFNPKNSPERLAAFNKFYKTIEHLNHRIIECVVGDVPRQLPSTPYITVVKTDSNLWHKEQLLNSVVRNLPPEFKYVLWVDADVLFTNKNWMVDAVEKLKVAKVVQLFENCHHLDRGETKPSPEWDHQRQNANTKYPTRRWWKGYAANYVRQSPFYESQTYELRGHVGFAWGARREVLEAVPLYDRGLIGGADGIIAYASTGQLRSVQNIREMFVDTLEDVYEWGDRWHKVVNGRLGYIKGDLYHIWHGNVENRQYYKRIKEFGPHMSGIRERDRNGLYITRDPKARKYVSGYYDKRDLDKSTDDNFAQSVALGYATNDGLLGGAIGGNLIGGMIGDALNTSDNTPSSPPAYSGHGGDTGGAGATASWDAPSNNSVDTSSITTDTNYS